MMQNQAPEQRARERIDDQWRATGWVVQGMTELNPATARGLEVREYPTDTGPMVCNPKVPPEFFDVIAIDECHRSIYNLWCQVIECFDSFLVGLTATPDNRSYAFFHQNVVSEYSLEQPVVDGVNVDHFVWRIDTRLTREGGKIEAEETAERRDRLTRDQRWSGLNALLQYAGTRFDSSMVNPSRTHRVIRAFPNALPRMCPDRQLLASEASLPPGTFYV